MIKNLFQNQIKCISIYNNVITKRFKTNKKNIITDSNTTNTINNTPTNNKTQILPLPKETIDKDDIFIAPKKYDRFRVITKEKQIELFHQALREAGGVTMEDFQKVNYLKFSRSKAGCTIFGYYGGSKTRLAYSLFPDYPWKSWLFNRQGLDVPNQREDSNYDYRAEFEWWAAKNNITEDNLDKWYSVNYHQFRKQCKLGNLTTLQIRELLISLYPNHKFYLWKFRFPGSEIWSRPEVVAEFRQHLLNETGFTTMEQFYFFTINRIKSLYGFSLIHLYKSDIQKIMSHIFPEYNWDPELFKGSEKMKQLLKQYIISRPKPTTPITPILTKPYLSRSKRIASVFKRKDIENLLNK